MNRQLPGNWVLYTITGEAHSPEIFDISAQFPFSVLKMKVFGDLPSPYKRKKNLSTENLQRYFKKSNNSKPSPRVGDSSSDTYSWSPLSSSRSADGSSLSSHTLNVSFSDNDINFYRLPSGDVENCGGKRKLRELAELQSVEEEVASSQSTEKEGQTTVTLKASHDPDKVKKDICSNSLWTQQVGHEKAFRIAFRLLEAKKIPIKHGYYFVVRLKSTDPGNDIFKLQQLTDNQLSKRLNGQLLSHTGLLVFIFR